MSASFVASKLDPAKAILNEVCKAGDPWTGIVKKGQIFRILDLEGNQAVDTLFYNAEAHYYCGHLWQARYAWWRLFFRK
jgi:uncharacterized protein YcgI (DUF1989 family)